MSHRRKNAHPTSKLRRTVVPESSSLASTDSVGEADPNSKMVLPAEDLVVHRDNPQQPATQITSSLLPVPPTSSVSPDPPGPSVSTPHLSLPPDLWEDFQALQAATHLDTASLIRRLIHQYGRSGPQTENDRPSSATDTDTTICADDVTSPSGGGETATFYGEHASCLGGDMGILPLQEYPPAHGLIAEEEDCLILDLSSGGRGTQHSPSTAPAPSDVRMGYPDDAEDDVERPLDLTVSKAREFSHSAASEDMLLSKAPEAHRTPSNAILLSALSHGMVHSAVASAPPTHLREAHSAVPGITSFPRPVSSSLFNLSELPLAGQRVTSTAHTEQPQNKLLVSSGSRWSEEAQTKQKIVQHFLSLPADHVQMSDVQQTAGAVEKPGCVLKVSPSSADTFRHLDIASASPRLSCTQKCTDHSHLGSCVASSSATMQLPTLTSVDFQGAGNAGKTGVGGQEEAGLGQPAVAVTLSSLPTSASAILLDMSSGGLVAGTGGGLTGVSTLNIPLMTTGTGGLVAIPLLHTLPEALAAAAAATQGPLPTTSTCPSTSTISQPSPPSQPVNDRPPPPPYSAAVAATAQPKKYKAKMGRPRGQPKAQKTVCKDMKLLTENTLFPGVYTSILKLPWSKRSRGKSSVKIKDVIGTSTPAASACSTEQQAVQEHREPREIPSTAQQKRLQEEQQQPPSSASSNAAALSILSMPLLVQDQTSSPSTVLPPSSSSSFSSSSMSTTSSVMMVYHNSVMSEQGKPMRKRGRPPKLPVLSQLLTENPPYCDRPPDDDQPTTMDTGVFSLIPLAAHPAFDASAVAFPPSVGDSSAVGFAAGVPQEQLAGIKQEPMEVTDSQANRLFPLVLERKEDPGNHPLHRHSVKQETDDAPAAVKSADVRDASDRHAEIRNADVRFSDVREHDMRDAGMTQSDMKDADVRGGQSGDQEASAAGRADKGDGGDGFQDPNLETRFHMLANQLGLEIGSPYHTSLVYGHSPTAAAKNFLYQPVMLPPQGMVEMKPRRRQLNNLIKPSDDCVYTSFRIRPRNSGRRGGKRGGRRRGAGARYNTSKLVDQEPGTAEDLNAKESYFKQENDKVRSESGSAVITERIPGAGEIPQRLYQDLYHCKVCNELLPVDNSLPHTCAPSASPPLCACDACGTMFLSSPSLPEGPALPRLCEDCTCKSQQHSVPEESSQDPSFSEGFACQPCGVHFVNISDYIQHRRSAHLDKMSRQSRKTHTLKTLPCPARGCPRLFHMHAELTRHLRNDHPEEVDQTADGAEGGEISPTPSPLHQDLCQDVDVETIPDKETENVDEEHAQFSCTQADCGQRFATALQLVEHVQACHEGISQWPCPLPGCSRQFGTERHLRVHLLMHKEEKPLKCPLCHYRCRQKNALQWHMRKHPESAGQYRKFAGITADP